MTHVKTDSLPAVQVKIAGLLYLLIILCGLSGELLVRADLIVAGDATATAANIAASGSLFRLGFAADTIMLLSDVAVAVLFYLLFKPVNKTLALMAAAFRLTQAAVLGLNLLNYHAALLLLSNVEYTAGFKAGQLHALALLFLDLHRHGYDLGLLFFGLSNLFLGCLAARSGYFPAILGYGLIAAGWVYLGGGFVRFLVPEYPAFVELLYLIPLLAESAFCLWLLAGRVKAQTV